MRALTTAQTAALASNEAITHVRVLIDKDGAGTFQNICDLEGRDWLDGVTYDDNVDQPGYKATIDLYRAENLLTLATLMEDSKLNQQPLGNYVPMITVNRDVKIETAVLAAGTTPISSDWVNVFEGQIDEVDLSQPSKIKLVCRDKHGYLMDKWIESHTNYGTAAGRAMETVMQDILTAWAPGVTLYVPSSPGFNIYPYQQTKEPVLDALNKLAQMIGWLVKYKWHDGTSAWRLTLYEPERAKIAPDYTFGPTQYFNVDRLSISRIGIRNKIKIIYTDFVTQARTTVTRSDAGSQTKYGTRYMEIAEDAASQVDTQAEAENLGDAILDDLKDPAADQQITVPYFWPGETGVDLLRFSANADHYSTDQDFGLVAISHSIKQSGARTTLTTRGQPSGGFKRWLRMEARGAVQGTDTDGPPQPTGVGGLATNGAIEVTYDMPTEPDWAYSECHVSTTSGFTPNHATKFMDGRTNRFTIGGLVQGTTYYIKILSVDIRGNKSLVSSQIEVAAQLQGPGGINPDTQQGNIVLNSDFGVWSSPNTPTNSPPDNWTCVYSDDGGVTFVEDNSLWGPGDGQIFYDTEKSQQASYSVRMRKNNFAASGHEYRGISSVFLPLAEGAIYQLSSVVRTEAPSDLYVAFFFYDREKNYVTTTATIGSLPETQEWFRSEQYRKVSANIAFVKILIAMDATGAHGDILIDRVCIKPATPSFLAVGGELHTEIIGISAYTAVTLAAEEYDRGSDFTLGDSLSTDAFFTAPNAGEYAFSGSASLTGMGANTGCNLAIELNGAVVIEGPVFIESPYAYTVATINVASMELEAGDIVKLMIFHNSGGTVREDTTNTLTWFRGICLREA